MSAATEASLTIKSGKGYEAMWVVPKGTPTEIRDWLVEFFGIEQDAVAGLSPYEVSVMAEDLAQGRTTVASGLGATVVKTEEGPKAKGWSKGKAKAEPEDEAPGHAWLVEELNNAATVDDLKRLWAQNKPAFEDGDVKAAYSARGKALKPKS